MKNKKAIKDFLSYLENERKFSPHTLRGYKIDLCNFNQFLKVNNFKQNFIDISKNDLQTYIQFLSKKNFSTKTILRRIASIKSLYKFLSFKGFLSKNIDLFIYSNTR